MAFDYRTLAGLLMVLACHTAHADMPDAENAAPLTAANAAVISAQFAEHRGLSEIPDADMGMIEAQAGSLIIADRIAPNELTSVAGDRTGFSYYRMGIDGKLDFNANISKLQLGCGGVNNLLTGPGCDIDIDYVSFMGINADGNAPGIAGSPFQMTRPFVEIAFKNENNPAKREMVGFRLGAQSINGALGLGREYAVGETNLERGGICGSGTSGPGLAACHAGINSVSGYLGLELSAAIQADAKLDLGLFGDLPVTLNTCFGRMTPAKYGCSSSTAPFLVDAGGTRLDTLHVAAAKLNIDNIAIDLGCAWWNLACIAAEAVGGSIASAIINEGYGQLKIDMRAVHYLLTPNTDNFFLSFQRERVSWPNYSKTLPLNNKLYDACYGGYSGQPARCSSAYAPAANTGWWLNAPGAKLLNINPAEKVVINDPISLATAISLLGPEGRLIIENPKIGLARPDNCHGTAQFC